MTSPRLQWFKPNFNGSRSCFWFMDRIGKKIYGRSGIYFKIEDSIHANRLYENQKNKRSLIYFDTKEEAEQYKNNQQ